MERKIILNLAMSLDGYIASEDGGFDWIVGDGQGFVDTKEKHDFQRFLDSIDVVVMGKKCYDQKMHKDYIGKKVYIATSEKLENYDNVYFINENIVDIILDEQKKEGKDIYLFGGGILIDSFIKDDVIDEYIVGIIPTILGKGRKLFLENNPKIDLKLVHTLVNDGIVMMRYEKR